MSSVIQLQGLEFRYGGAQQPTLSGIDLQVESGTIVGILGPNGSGKTTLLHLMSGSLRANRGEVRVNGQKLSKLSPRMIAKTMAVVPAAEHTTFSFSVQEIVSMGRSPHIGGFGLLLDEDLQIVETEMRALDIWHLRERDFAALSAGETKRVIMARALAQRTSIVLLDEPTAFLDIHHQLSALTLLFRRVKELSLTVVMVLHDLNLAAQFCDKVLLIKNGRITATGTVEEVMTYRKICDTFDAEVYVGLNEINRKRFFVPMLQE